VHAFFAQIVNFNHSTKRLFEFLTVLNVIQNLHSGIAKNCRPRKGSYEERCELRGKIVFLSTSLNRVIPEKAFLAFLEADDKESCGASAWNWFIKILNLVPETIDAELFMFCALSHPD
jgi:hypothetical protein